MFLLRSCKGSFVLWSHRLVFCYRKKGWLIYHKRNSIEKIVYFLYQNDYARHVRKKLPSWICLISIWVFPLRTSIIAISLSSLQVVSRELLCQSIQLMSDLLLALILSGSITMFMRLERAGKNILFFHSINK